MNIKKTALYSSVILAVAASPALAALSANTTTELNLRSGPGAQYDIQSVIPASAEVAVEGCLAGGEWCEVSFGGETGWAYSAYLTTPVENEPVVLYQAPQTIEIETVTYDNGNKAVGGTAGAGAVGQAQHRHPKVAADAQFGIAVGHGGQRVRQRPRHPGIAVVDGKVTAERHPGLAVTDLLPGAHDVIGEIAHVALGLHIPLVVPVPQHPLGGRAVVLHRRLGVARPAATDPALIVQQFGLVAAGLGGAHVLGGTLLDGLGGFRGMDRGGTVLVGLEDLR